MNWVLFSYKQLQDQDAGRSWTLRRAAKLRACYLGMYMKVDDMLCKLCDPLKEAGECGNSAIFSFSDHDDFTGNYSICEKTQNIFEDCFMGITTRTLICTRKKSKIMTYHIMVRS